MFEWLNGKKSKEETMNFFQNILDSSNGIGKHRPSSNDLNRVKRVARIFREENPKAVYPYPMGNKFFVKYQNITSSTGLVYHGNVTELSYDKYVPHGYGEFSFRSSLGDIFYAGYFDKGTVYGECRISFINKGTCYGRVGYADLTDGTSNIVFYSSD